MTHTPARLALIACSLAPLSAFAQASSGPAEARPETVDEAPMTSDEETDFTVLFDGSDASFRENFRQYNGDALSEGWQVIDGNIVRVANGAGDFITQDMYMDFDLRFEWKVEPGVNSGVFYWVREIPDTPAYHTGIEYQIIDNGDHDPLHFQRAGACYELVTPTVDASKPAGEWNTGRIVVEDGHLVTHYLNGEELLSYDMFSMEFQQALEGSKFADWEMLDEQGGHLGLQDHGGRVYYRNIRVAVPGE